MKNPGTKTGKKHKFTMGMAVLYFLLTALVFICLYPFLNVLAYSLSGYNAVLSGDVTFYPIEFTLDAYKQILGRAQIWIAMRVTIFVTLMGTAIGLVLTIFAAYALSRKNLRQRLFVHVFCVYHVFQRRHHSHLPGGKKSGNV